MMSQCDKYFTNPRHLQKMEKIFLYVCVVAREMVNHAVSSVDQVLWKVCVGIMDLLK